MISLVKDKRTSTTILSFLNSISNPDPDYPILFEESQLVAFPASPQRVWYSVPRISSLSLIRRFSYARDRIQFVAPDGLLDTRIEQSLPSLSLIGH